MTKHEPALLDKLLARAQGYVEFAMCKIGHVPPKRDVEGPILDERLAVA